MRLTKEERRMIQMSDEDYAREQERVEDRIMARVGNETARRAYVEKRGPLKRPTLTGGETK